MGPNNPNRVLEDTNDISYYTAEGREVTGGILIWEETTAGQQTLALTIKPHTVWEVSSLLY